MQLRLLRSRRPCAWESCRGSLSSTSRSGTSRKTWRCAAWLLQCPKLQAAGTSLSELARAVASSELLEADEALRVRRKVEQGRWPELQLSSRRGGTVLVLRRIGKTCASTSSESATSEAEAPPAAVSAERAMLSENVEAAGDAAPEATTAAGDTAPEATTAAGETSPEVTMAAGEASPEKATTAAGEASPEKAAAAAGDAAPEATTAAGETSPEVTMAAGEASPEKATTAAGEASPEKAAAAAGEAAPEATTAAGDAAPEATTAAGETSPEVTMAAGEASPEKATTAAGEASPKKAAAAAGEAAPEATTAAGDAAPEATTAAGEASPVKATTLAGEPEEKASMAEEAAQSQGSMDAPEAAASKLGASQMAAPETSERHVAQGPDKDGEGEPAHRLAPKDAAAGFARPALRQWGVPRWAVLGSAEANFGEVVVALRPFPGDEALQCGEVQLSPGAAVRPLFGRQRAKALQLLSKRARAEMEECQSAKRRCERKELALQAKAAVGIVSL
ncbi:unnamed protein product [Effrenium voratum]|nr:unnamed protein product [Effrenium voratum]